MRGARAPVASKLHAETVVYTANREAATIQKPLRPATSTPRPLRRALVVMALPALLGACASGSAPHETPSNQLAFGVEMAQRGLWQEALFRFRQAERAGASDPRVLNNLAVAYEAVGDFDRALEVYKRALAAAPENRELKRNYARFVEFYQSFRPKVAADGAATAAVPPASAAGTPPTAAPPPPPAPQPTPPSPEQGTAPQPAANPAVPPR